jgi:V/A-type H+-transporting ATPase subunit I
MRRIEIAALGNDMDSVLYVLGGLGIFQIVPPDGERNKTIQADGRLSIAKSYKNQLEAIEEIRRGLDLEYPSSILPGARMPRRRDEKLLASMRSTVSALAEAEHHNLVVFEKTREALERAMKFSDLPVSFSELDTVSFLSVRIGKIENDKKNTLKESLKNMAVIINAGDNGTIIAVAAASHCSELDEELAKSGFESINNPPKFAGKASESIEALEKELRRLESERAEIWMRKSELRSKFSALWSRIATSYAVAASIEEAKASVVASDIVCKLQGWVPETETRRLVSSLERTLPGRVAVRAFEPEEIEHVAAGREEVPVKLNNPPLVSSFEPMVRAFGVPTYGSVDPTPFVCFFFTVLFSIMFGDLGQGFLIFLFSAVLYFGRLHGLSRWKIYAPLGMAAGMGSMIMGFLTGSVFTFEDALVPLTRSISSTLFGTSVDRFLQIMPSEGPQRTLAFFGFTLALGSLVNSTGLVLNIINKIRRGSIAEAVFSKTGIAGALFFWWSLGMGLRAVFGSKPEWFDALGLGLPLLAMMFEEQFCRIIEAHRRIRPHQSSGEELVSDNNESVLIICVKAFVALIESISYYLSGTLSFLRVGAFALSHVVLSYIVFELGGMLGRGSFAGMSGRVAVVLIGNAIILLLEGLVVVVQVIRLQYYEFLSKFVTENARSFEPFKFHFAKEST